VGEYTTTVTSFTQFATSGSGTGATFNNGLYGVLGNTISDPGDYTVLPSNHIATSGGGGATFDATWDTIAGPFLSIDTVGQLVTFDNFQATGDDSGANYTYMTGGEVLKVRVQFAATFTTYTMKVFVFGFTFS
jgi:hypothetical protein